MGISTKQTNELIKLFIDSLVLCDFTRAKLVEETNKRYLSNISKFMQVYKGLTQEQYGIRPPLHGVTGVPEGHTSDLSGHKKTFCVQMTAYCVHI